MQKLNTLNLPFPISVNRLYKQSKGLYRSRKGNYYSKRYVIPEAKNYKQMVKLYCYQQKVIPHENDVKVHVDVSPPDKRHRDIDNIAKLLLDALQFAGVFKNDNQVRSFSLSYLDNYEPNNSVIVTTYDLGTNYYAAKQKRSTRSKIRGMG